MKNFSLFLPELFVRCVCIELPDQQYYNTFAFESSENFTCHGNLNEHPALVKIMSFRLPSDEGRLISNEECAALKFLSCLSAFETWKLTRLPFPVDLEFFSYACMTMCQSKTRHTDTMPFWQINRSFLLSKWPLWLKVSGFINAYKIVVSKN